MIDWLIDWLIGFRLLSTDLLLPPGDDEHNSNTTQPCTRIQDDRRRHSDVRPRRHLKVIIDQLERDWLPDAKPCSDVDALQHWGDVSKLASAHSCWQSWYLCTLCTTSMTACTLYLLMLHVLYSQNIVFNCLFNFVDFANFMLSPLAFWLRSCNNARLNYCFADFKLVPSAGAVPGYRTAVNMWISVEKWPQLLA